MIYKLGFGIVIGLALLLTGSATATTYTVCSSGCDFSSIQTAIDAATSGDTINVLSGTYNEQIIIDKSLILQGENRDTTIIDGGGTGDVVLINADNVVFKGFKIINSGENPSGLPYNGIKLLSANYCMVSDNIVSNNDHGIALWTSSNNNLVENNIASNNNVGIVIADNSKYNTIRENNASFNFYHGINPYLNSDENIIVRNTVLNNGYYGITPDSAHDNMITENFVSGNTYGIYTYSYYSQSSGNKIYHNNIIGNINQAYDDSGLNFWDNGYPSGGNYWSDYIGADNFKGPNQDQPGSDGIGDIPYNIMGIPDTKDHYPLMNPWVPPTPTPTTLTFFITDSDTGLPIDSATVELKGIFKGKTDINGEITFEIYYEYTVKKKGYQTDKGIVSPTEKMVNVELIPKK
jgi:nitrous oxidase accessory protein